jgi:hypothetical protein
MKKKYARFAVLKDERGLILGKDLGKTFKKGIVYEVVEILDTLVIRPVGPFSLPKKSDGWACWGSDVNTQVEAGRHLWTKEEWKEKCKRGNKNADR